MNFIEASKLAQSGKSITLPELAEKKYYWKCDMKNGKWVLCDDLENKEGNGQMMFPPHLFQRLDWQVYGENS